LANAFAYTHLGKRDNLVGELRRMPLPAISHRGTEAVVEAARAYLRAVVEDEANLKPGVDQRSARALLFQVDAEVLRLYGFPPRTERQLLDMFAGWQRPGVPFVFDRYFPEEFEPCLPLHEYLSDAYQRSTAGQLRARHRSVTCQPLLAAMNEAVKAFEE